MSMKDLLNKMTELTGTQASTEVVSTGKKVLTENTGATDYEGKKGVNRTEALKKYANSKDPKDAEAARKAGATQTELKQAKDEVKESKPSLKGIFNSMLNENDQITIQPAKQNTQVIKQGQKTLGTVENPQLAQQIKQSIGKGEMTLAGDDLNETEDDRLELYGLRIGDTVKATYLDRKDPRGPREREVQGDVIDIFPDDMEVELLLRGPDGGKTIRVDVRDTEYLDETENNNNITKQIQDLLDRGEKVRSGAKHKGLPDKKEKMDEHNQVLDKSKYFDKSVKPKVGDVVIVVRAMPFWSSWYHRGDEFTVAGIYKDGFLKVKVHKPDNRFNNHGVTLKHPVDADHVRVMKPTTEAAMPTHDGDFGAGLGAGRNSKTLESKKAKPDYIDLDKDSNKKESMKKAAANKQKVSTMKKTNEDKGTPIMLSPVGKDKKDNKSTPALCTKHNKPLYKKGEGENAWRGCEDCPPKKTNEAKAKPDYIDLDKDGNKTEPMKKAVADATKNVAVKEGRLPKVKVEKRLGKYAVIDDGEVVNTFIAKYEADEYANYLNDKKAVADKKKKTVKEGANPTESARLLGKAHAMANDTFSCKYEEGSPEAQAYLDGYKEGLDECYGSGGGMGMQQSIGMMPGMDSMVSMTDTPSPRGGSEFEVDSMDDVGGVGGFDSQPDEADMMAFEAWDRQLNELLNEGSDTETKKPVKEGISVSVSKGQQGAPDSVTVSAQDGDADALLAMIKQAGLGLFGGEEQSGYGAPTTPQMPTSGASDIGDHDSMMALIKQMTTGSNDYEDEESQDDTHVHGHPDAACDACGSSDCGCDDESDSKAVVVGEEETEDQMEFEVAEDADSDEAETTADEDAEAEEDKALAGADSDNEEEIDEEKELNEWANDAGYTGSENTKDNTFEEDIDFMTRVISSGLNGPKKDQTTLPHTKVTVDDVSESIVDWKKLSGIK